MHTFKLSSLTLNAARFGKVLDSMAKAICDCHSKLEGWIDKKVSWKVFYAGMVVVIGLYLYMQSQTLSTMSQIAQTQSEVQRWIAAHTEKSQTYLGRLEFMEKGGRHVYPEPRTTEPLPKKE